MPRRRKGPLDGVLVADFSRVLAGPLCTQMLGDAGARVIKVEEPERGDETRRWGPPFVDGISTYFLSINRNKESMALDLRRGGKVARRLIERADVVVDNFLPPQRAALGLDDVPAINPRAIHCRIFGFDSDTPDALTPGYDLLAQASSGLMSITGASDGEPAKVGVAVADVLTAHHAFGAIMTALFARERTGRGCVVEVSLFGSTVASLINVAQAVLATGRDAKRYGNEHASIVPYQVFHGRDRAFAIGAGTDRHYQLLCEKVIDRPELARDERFDTNAARVSNRGVLIPLLESIFATRTAADWVRRCRRHKIPAAVVQTVREALRSNAARPIIDTVEHPVIGSYEAVGYPVRVDGERFAAGSAPPALGAHTDHILRELGYGRAEIASLKREGITAARATSPAGRRRKR